jgi:hypothetical protein
MRAVGDNRRQPNASTTPRRFECRGRQDTFRCTARSKGRRVHSRVRPQESHLRGLGARRARHDRGCACTAIVPRWSCRQRLGSGQPLRGECVSDWTCCQPASARTIAGVSVIRPPRARSRWPAWKPGTVAGERRRPATSSRDSDMGPPRTMCALRASSRPRARARSWGWRSPRAAAGCQHAASPSARRSAARRPGLVRGVRRHCARHTRQHAMRPQPQAPASPRPTALVAVRRPAQTVLRASPPGRSSPRP